MILLSLWKRFRAWAGHFSLVRRLYRTWQKKNRISGLFRLLKLFGFSTTLRLHRTAISCWWTNAPINERIRRFVSRMAEEQCAGSSVQTGWLYHNFALPEYGFRSHRQNTDRRLALIRKHVPFAHSRVLDIGCSSGGMTLGMALLGASQVFGVDYDPTAIDVAKAVAEKYDITNARFDAADFMTYTLPQVDTILWLSQWMWMVKQHGMEEGRRLLFEVPKNTQASFMAFESAAADKSAPIQGATQKTIEEYLRAWSPFADVRNAGPFQDEWTLPGEEARNVYVCSRPEWKWKGYQSTAERRDTRTVRKTYKESFRWAGAWESRCLKKLEASPHFPKVLAEGDGWIDLEWMGHAARGTDDLAQLSDITQALQGAGIVHRDLRPENLLWKEGVLSLIDFGWAIIDGQKPPVEAPDYLGCGYYDAPNWDDEEAARRVVKKLTEIAS